MEDRFQVGVITSTHGLKGEVKVYPTTDDPGKFEVLESVLLDDRELEISGVRYFKQFAILKFRGLDRIEDVEPLKGKSLYVTREYAVPLEDDEYYIADLIGIAVENEDGEPLGIIKDVITTAANDVYVVQTTQKKEILIPAIKECILHVDVEAGRMLVHLLPGLVD